MTHLSKRHKEIGAKRVEATIPQQSYQKLKEIAYQNRLNIGEAIDLLTEKAAEMGFDKLHEETWVPQKKKSIFDLNIAIQKVKKKYAGDEAAINIIKAIEQEINAQEVGPDDSSAHFVDTHVNQKTDAMFRAMKKRYKQNGTKANILIAMLAFID
jgi:hypothetical protein